MTHALMHFALNVIAFGFNLGVVVSVVVVITFDYSRFDGVERIVKKWETPLISEVAVMTAREYTDKCSASSNEDNCFEPLFSYSFPGTEEGCDCSASNGTEEHEYEWEGLVLKGKCNSVQIGKGCSNINAVEEVNVYNVMDSEETVFVKRSHSDNTYKKWYLSGNVRRNCSYGSDTYRSCGVIDTINNHLCIEEHIPCPFVSVNNLHNSNNSVIPALSRVVDEIVTNKHLFIDTISTPFHHICANPRETPFTNQQAPYPLYSFQSSSSSSFYECHSHILNTSYDTTYIPLTSYPISSSFPPAFLSLLHSLPQFPYDNFTSQNITLFYKGYSGWDSSCADSLSLLHALSSMKYYFKGYFTLFLINALIILPYYLLFIMIITQIDHMNHKLHLLLHVSYIVLIVILIVIVGWCYRAANELSQQLKVVASKACGDGIVIRLMLNVYGDMSSIAGKVFNVEVWLVLMVLSYGLKVILVFTKMNKRAMMALLTGREGGVEGNRGVITMMEIEMVSI